ncbi:MAG: 2'-5' RNA ligase family protein, partial [bacterium]
MNNSSQIIRAFVAVPIPENVKQLALETGVSLLNSTKELKLVKSENIHITLAFIGDVESDLLEHSYDALDKLAVETLCIEVEFDRIGTFPSLIFLKTSIGESEL